MYKCLRCGSEMDDLSQGLIRCSNCAYKILVKIRSPITKTIKAR